MGILEDDRALLEAYRRGEQQAMERVYIHYAPELMSKLRARLGNPGGNSAPGFPGYGSVVDIEDIVQESFCRAFSDQARLAYDGLRSFGAYLLAIARHWVIDTHVRSRVAKLDGATILLDTDPTHDAAVEQWEADGPEQQATLEEREIVRFVSDLARGLSEVERSVMRLRLLEGREQSDVAAALGLSVYKVRKLERRVRRQLGQALQHRFGGGTE